MKTGRLAVFQTPVRNYRLTLACKKLTKEKNNKKKYIDKVNKEKNNYRKEANEKNSTKEKNANHN